MMLSGGGGRGGGGLTGNGSSLGPIGEDATFTPDGDGDTDDSSGNTTTNTTTASADVSAAASPKVNDTYEYNETCEVTPQRLAHAVHRSSLPTSCHLTRNELSALLTEQNHVAKEDGHLSLQERERVAREAEKKRRGILNLRAQMMRVMARSRFDLRNDGVLGVQPTGFVENSLIVPEGGGGGAAAISAAVLGSVPEGGDRGRDEAEEEKYNNDNNDGETHDALYNRQKDRIHVLLENKCFDATDVNYVRKPDITRIALEQSRRPKYTLHQVLLSRRFHLFKHRFANAQYRRTLMYPTLPQPEDVFGGTLPGYVCGECTPEDEEDGDGVVRSEKYRSRLKGHRFILAADTQFGIVMDGYAMDLPNWETEIELSRRAVSKINAMQDDERPLFVCVCGDLVDTESSFSRALASWKKVMSGWERNLIFEQQVKDFKRIWSGLDPDIALVCLCGNHDVGNRPTAQSIKHWTNSFGDDYFAFWANGTYNINLNNCLFSDPSGAPDLFQEQLIWLEEKLAYAKANDATHIFVYGHFPWFLKHENEGDDEITTFSKAPDGWGPKGSSFPDSYFTIPREERQMAMMLFQRYGVTACFSGHFHQNVVAKSSWGMPMIVTGPLSMTLKSELSEELSGGEPNGCGMRVVDVGEKGQFTHEFVLLDGKEYA